MKKTGFYQRLCAMFLLVVMVLPLCTAFELSAFAASAGSDKAISYIRNPSDAKGSDYTSIPKLASALDAIFAGDVDAFADSACQKEVKMPLGGKFSTTAGDPIEKDVRYYVKSKTTGNNMSGKQCYIYANAVYNKLFLEWVGNGASLSHSYKALSGGGQQLTFEMFQQADVKTGSMIRTTPSSKGTWDGNHGHNVIVLSYDKEKISYLEGNAEQSRYIQLVTQTWANFNYDKFKDTNDGNRYLCYLIQPNNEKFNELYPVTTCTHSYSTGYESAHPHKEYKKCSLCGAITYTGATQKKSGCTTCYPTSSYGSTNPDDYSFPERSLNYKSGSATMTGNDVAWVQAVLYQLGYDIDIDGKYGPGTRDIIKQFQKDYGLSVDGSCGQLTRTKLKEVWEAKKHVHTYSNACDASCNTCGATRSPSAHKYDNACDASCNVCGATRTPSAHVYDNACDKYCNVCGLSRTPSAHVYTNDCDGDCNICGATRTPASHKYDNACDKRCNVCGLSRTPASHKYDNACDGSCNVCGATRTPASHVYDNDRDSACNVCGHVRELTHLIGDLNGDGETDSNDAIYLLYFALLGNERYPVVQNADYNKDGSVTSEDAVYLLYYALLGADRYPLN